MSIWYKIFLSIYMARGSFKSSCPLYLSVKFCSYSWIFLYFYCYWELGLCIHLFPNRIRLVKEMALMVQFIIICKWWIYFRQIWANPYTSITSNLLFFFLIRRFQLFQLYWGMTDKNCIDLRCTTWCFDGHIPPHLIRQLSKMVGFKMHMPNG